MLNYNEYTSCLDTRLYKSGREIGVTSHRRRDSHVWRQQSPHVPLSSTFPTPLRKRLALFFLTRPMSP